MDASAVRTDFQWANEQKCAEALDAVYDTIRTAGAAGLTKITEDNSFATEGIINYVWWRLTKEGFSIEPVPGAPKVTAEAYVVSWSLY